jgi:hypothetical protein
MPIGAGSEELRQRRVVGALALDALEACGQRVARAPGELPGQVGDLFELEGGVEIS